VLVADTAARAAYFWQSEGAAGTDVEAVPVTGQLTCADEVAPTASALFCPTTGNYALIKYQPDVFQQRRERGGDLAVEITIAHEVAHAAQDAEGRKVATYPSRASAELSADCGAGAYLAAVNADPAAVQKALPVTALGKDTPSIGLRASDRREAFDAGFTGAVAPMDCLDYRG
jgi:predicted metalloprotease